MPTLAHKRIVKDVRYVTESIESKEVSLKDILPVCNITYEQHKESFTAFKHTVFHKKKLWTMKGRITTCKYQLSYVHGTLR
jgi:hypothetical protein